MTKKSKTKTKVTTSPAVSSNQEDDSALQSESAEKCGAGGAVKNGKIPSELITDTPSKIHSNNTSLASVPGIVDDFLAPKFVKVLNLRDHGYEKNPPPDLSEIKTRDSNANKVEDTTSVKKHRRKSKPKKSSNLSITYDYDDARELDDLSLNGGDGTHSDSIQSHLKSELSRKDADKLAKLERIRNSAFQYDGNNIVLVSNVEEVSPEDENDTHFQSCSYPLPTSSYDDYSYDYDNDAIATCGGGPGSASARSDETSILGLDLENEDDEEERVGSWSLSHHVDYCYPPKAHVSSSVASSESEHNASSSTTASGNISRGYPALASCSTIWDGVIHLCEIKDCSKPATKKCSQCKHAFYCGEDHQRIDWKRHKNDCTPYRMERRYEDDVSVAVAARNIPAGQVIFSERPLLTFAAADPENDFLNVMSLPCITSKVSKNEPKASSSSPACNAVRPACFGCLKSIEFIGPPRFKCNKCGLPLCSYNCQFALDHSAGECQAIEAQGGWFEDEIGCYHSLYMDVEILRALQLENYDHPQWERFLQMKQNLRVESYKESVKFRRFISNYRELVPISAKMTGYHDDLIGNVHAIITALSFRPSLNSSYKLIFATQILFAHDCIPNTFHYLEESTNGVSRANLVTKAAVPICKRELITIDFSPTPFLYYPLRRMILRNVLSIDSCTCKRCREPSSLHDRTADIKCPRCRHGLICAELPEKWKDSVWACNLCLEEFSYCMVGKITEECRAELASILLKPKQTIVTALSQFVMRREDHDLNPSHSIILQAWSFIENNLRPNLAATRGSGASYRYPESILEDYRLLGKCCDAMERHLMIIRPGICYERGGFLFNRYYVDLALSAKRYGLRLIKRKEYIQELMQCVKTLQDALKIFQMFEGYNRQVSLHIQDATSTLVTTKAYLHELMVTEAEETKRGACASTSLKDSL